MCFSHLQPACGVALEDCRDRHKAHGRWLQSHLVTLQLHKELGRIHGKEVNGLREREDRLRASAKQPFWRKGPRETPVSAI